MHGIMGERRKVLYMSSLYESGDLKMRMLDKQAFKIMMRFIVQKCVMSRAI